ncbi:MAG: bifunctional folylpolyglutamate synthase/dihydrofolate synthase [Bacteroidia bacterium]|nr:bifunctional folylpolyglutamate synthase/dihydrofolate synthase [Bacteroidia bacterium]NNF32328.1 bifunctional folylpolyglutamate synthase/dihydrofolate synthase [Flavobacteriaceae bacterium]MBT8276311.1 bifunctional folylpolyglutamate synthase/dihydrofolate synthase [Bacteroidia bacterium]NNJ81520.1 bifunctional folylpolyglutamate synthase/dihydrofolate synthase [Flavobacteriaceae bacterium]NNK53204.1 bifunctional folylpolyglutamate synthase/dihydrofolate synthase [Flavobacteriaceae bacteri
MNYSETITWLFNQLPMYQRVGKAAYKADLSNTVLLADHLGNPESSFKSVHIAGTNGKGSTSHMLAAILQHAGYKVGLYTSPHLKDFRERIRINGDMIQKEFVTGFIGLHREFFEENSLSFFEMTVGLAFEYFRDEEVDIAVIEVGLGGRLDSTNIITPEVSVITNIGFDHMNFLGNTLEEIAIEKAGIIKEGVPVVIGEIQKETRYVFEQVAEQNLAPICFAEEQDLPNYKTDLRGAYQQKNLRTTLAIIRVMRELHWNIPIDAAEKGLLTVSQTTGLRGRWEIIEDKPKVICDTAHNREGLEMALEQLRAEQYEKLFIVLGVVDDKDLEPILPLFPGDAVYHFCKPDVPRGMDAKKLKLKAAEFKLFGEAFNSVKEALRSALEKAGKEDVIYVGGSTFTVAEVI